MVAQPTHISFSLPNSTRLSDSFSCYFELIFAMSKYIILSGLLVRLKFRGWLSLSSREDPLAKSPWDRGFPRPLRQGLRSLRNFTRTKGESHSLAWGPVNTWGCSMKTKESTESEEHPDWLACRIRFLKWRGTLRSVRRSRMGSLGSKPPTRAQQQASLSYNHINVNEFCLPNALIDALSLSS